MTVKIPPKNILDKILSLIGKERKIIIPKGTDDIYKRCGPYVHIEARREGFWKTLFNKKSSE